MRVGIVCEGRTDFILLEQVVLAVFGPCEIDALQPMRDALAPNRWADAGWTRVKEWCEERRSEGIADEMAIGAIDVVVVHVDGDLCGQHGLPATRTDFCDHIKAAWIGPATPPPGTVICIPAQATDTWLAAALDGDIATPALETDRNPLAHLVRLGVLSPTQAGETAPRKSQYAYAARAGVLNATASALRTSLTELDRFMIKLEALLPLPGAP